MNNYAKNIIFCVAICLWQMYVLAEQAFAKQMYSNEYGTYKYCILFIYNIININNIFLFYVFILYILLYYISLFLL